MFYPVAIPGAYFSVGDPHAALGDSELGGTAIETSLTGDFEFVLHKKADLAGTSLEGLDRAAANRERRRRLRPPAILRCPLCCPLSASKGANPARAAACSRLTRPSSGMRMTIASAVRSPMPGTLSTSLSRLARSS